MVPFAADDFLTQLDAEMRRHLEHAAELSPSAGRLDPFYAMSRYHLGWIGDADANGAGKRLRPLLLARVAEALGAPVASALPAAAAVELLHNFTLVHDDIQDQSAFRRHRETVWRRWGAAQAINVGDALYAIAHEAVWALAEPPGAVPPRTILELTRDFDRTALRIVEGQYLDLANEGRWGGDESLYLATITGKTASLMAFCCRAGARLADAEAATVTALSDFGLALGLAFQIKDDILGIWAASSTTGKPAAADLRRRKRSLPVIILDGCASPAARAELRALYSGPELDDRAIARVLELLDRADIRNRCEAYVTRYHEAARASLASLGLPPKRGHELYRFLDALAARDF